MRFFYALFIMLFIMLLFSEIYTSLSFCFWINEFSEKKELFRKQHSFRDFSKKTDRHPCSKKSRGVENGEISDSWHYLFRGGQLFCSKMHEIEINRIRAFVFIWKLNLLTSSSLQTGNGIQFSPIELSWRKKNSMANSSNLSIKTFFWEFFMT